MTKKQIRAAGYNFIVKENKSHQETFDELSITNGIEKKMLADELSKIPSNGKQNSTSALRYIFIISLVLLAGLRIFGIIVLGMSTSMNASVIGLLVFFGVIVPGIGIYGAIYAKVELYMTTGIFLTISLFRSITRGELNAEPETLLVMIPFFVAVALAFFIPTRLKTSYQRTVKEHFIDGKSQKKIAYEFEDTRASDSGLLDSNF